MPPPKATVCPRGLRRAVTLVWLTIVVWCSAASPSFAGPLQPAVPGPAITGTSTAWCMPSPCGPGKPVAYTLPAVSNDNGTFSTRAYEVYRPANLTASATNLAPAYLVFNASGSCGYSNAGQWQNLATANRFIVVNMEVPCARPWDPNVWAKKWVDAAGATTPDDEPYVRAVVTAIRRCPGDCVDPRRIYAVGQSAGANMVADIMCDPQSSPLFRGYHIDSSSLELFGGAPDCPSTNRNLFVMVVLSNYAADRGLYYDTLPTPHLDINQSGVHFQNWAARHLGCVGSERIDRLGSQPSQNTGPNGPAMTLRYREMAPCAFATDSAAVESLAVINGGHGWLCQDSLPGTFACPVMPNPPGLSSTGAPWTDGLSVEQEYVNFVNAGVSPG